MFDLLWHFDEQSETRPVRIMIRLHEIKHAHAYPAFQTSCCRTDMLPMRNTNIWGISPVEQAGHLINSPAGGSGKINSS